MRNKAITMLLLTAVPSATEACTHRPMDLKPIITPPAVCNSSAPTFNKDIQPIFSAGCAKTGCHDGNSMPHNYSVYSELLPGIADSAIYYYVIKDRTMPQDTPLSAADINTLKCWFANGCPEK